MAYHRASLILAKTRRFLPIILLSVCWCCGFFLGLHIAAESFTTTGPWMRRAAEGRVSVFGFFTVLTFPLVLSVIFAYFSATALFFPLSFLKAFGFAYCAYGITQAFGNAGWLMYALLLFSDSCIVLTLLWFWIRTLWDKGAMLRKNFSICAVASLIIGCIDCFLIAPFLQSLFQ